MARPRAADFEDKKRAILGSAARVLAVRGMDKTSMAQIADGAGVSKALLYHYYASRDRLVFDIIRTHLGDLEAAVAQADDPALDPRERLRALIGAVLEQYRDADDHHKIQLNGTPTLAPDLRAQIVAIERRIVAPFSRCLSEIAPELGASRLMPVTMSVFGMMNWVYMWFRDGGPLTRDAYAEIACAMVLGGLPEVVRGDRPGK